MHEQIIAADVELDANGEGVEDGVFELMARQAPVASELRMLVTALRMVADLERLADLAAHVAKIARMRYLQPAIPVELHDLIGDMGSVAERMVNAVGDAIKTRDVEAARKLETADDEMDRLRSNQFRLMMGAPWPHGVEVAVDIALLGRYYERIATSTIRTTQSHRLVRTACRWKLVAWDIDRDASRAVRAVRSHAGTGPRRANCATRTLCGSPRPTSRPRSIACNAAS
jgi:phosphate uptake regulator